MIPIIATSNDSKHEAEYQHQDTATHSHRDTTTAATTARILIVTVGTCEGSHQVKLVPATRSYGWQQPGGVPQQRKGRR